MLSAAVAGVIKYSKELAGHTPDVMDVRNCQQYIHCNNNECHPVIEVDDARLNWLEHAFIAYLEDLRDASRTENFFSKETCHALLFTTQSYVAFIRNLLTEKKSKSVLARCRVTL